MPIEEKKAPRTRMNNAHRDVLRNFAEKKIAEVVDRKHENKLLKLMVKMTNQAIRKKYPEKHMEVLRLYKVTRTDTCMTYHFPSGRVDGFTFSDEDGLHDMPRIGGCHSREAFTVNEEFEKAWEEFATLKKTNDEIAHQKRRDCDTLITYAKYVEDVLEVIKVPKEIEASLVAKSTALVALSPDVIERIQADFSA